MSLIAKCQHFKYLDRCNLFQFCLNRNLSLDQNKGQSNGGGLANKIRFSMSLHCHHMHGSASISILPVIGVKSLSLTMLHQANVLFKVDDIHKPASVELTLTTCFIPIVFDFRE